jgi:sigma-B regulation protein RsbQ
MAPVLKRNAVIKRGDGPPIVLVHGFGCDQSMWRALEARLEGYQRISYDLTGMGASDYAAYDEARHGQLAGHAQDLIEVLDAVNVGPALVVGHSVSAMIAGLASIQRPELFRGIVMIGPNPCYVDEAPYVGGFKREDVDGLLAAVEQNYAGWAGQLAGMVGGPDSPDAVSELETRFCKNDPLITRHFARVTFLADNRADVPLIATETLVVQSSEDNIAPTSVGDYMLAHLPNGQLTRIACRGHAPHMTQPEATAAAITRFASRLK